MPDSGRADPLLRKRLTAQMLSGPKAHDPLSVVERLLAVQGQDPRGARLAIRARSSGLAASDVDSALSNDRSLLITWLNRGTLHLVRSQDYGWLHALTTPSLLSGNARRLAQEGVSPAQAERGVRTIVKSLSKDGPLTRAQLRDRLDSAGVPTLGQALVHVLALASIRGHIVRGPMIGKDHAVVLVEDWLTPQPRVGRSEALRELALRYLAGHGPASDRDLAGWAGLPLRDARAGLASVGSRLKERSDGLLELRSAARSAPLSPPRLLGSFDPLLLGWASREPVLGAAKNIITVNGLFRPFALINGRAAATWKMPGSRVVIEPLRRLSLAEAGSLQTESDRVRAFLGLSLDAGSSEAVDFQRSP